MPEAKLLIYTHALAGGGAERVCSLLASGFARQGWRVVFAVDSEDDANRAFVDASVAMHVLGRNHARAIWRLARLLRQEKPDVTLSAIGVSNVKHAAAAVLSGRAHRAVLSCHAFAASEPQRLSQAAYWLAPILSRVTARTVAVSHGLRTHLIERWHAEPSKTTTIYNPVRVGADTTRLSEPGRPPMVLSAGRLIADKNMRGLVRAFARIADRSGAHLTIVGEGPDRAAIEADVERLGLTGRVHLPGYVSEPWLLYRSAACFALSSRLESFSMVIAEALLHGVPVVAYDSPGPREVLADGAFGALVPLDDEAGLAEAMLTALDSHPDEERLRARGRMFSLEAGLEAYGRLFAEVMAQAGSRPSPQADRALVDSRLEPQ